jgi:urease accessory protein UreH
MDLKRFRIGTLMLIIVIAALGTALVVQHNRALRREAELKAKIRELEQADLIVRWREMSERRLRQFGHQAAEKRRPVEAKGMEARTW